MPKPFPEEKRQEWKRLVEEWETSDQKISIARWCAKQNIRYNNFLYWRERFSSNSTRTIDRACFQELIQSPVYKCETAYMWVVVGGNSSNPAYRVYDFRKDRCHDHVIDILQKYRGGLHSDKFAAYQRLAEKKVITWFPCWSHIRRKFFEAESGDVLLRNWALRKIRYLFMLEKVAWARSAEERLRIRQEKEAPIIDELIEKIKNRLTQGKLLPKSKFREALGYFCGLIPYLKNYTRRSFARLDNNVAERAIRPLAIGRKNWLFFGSEDGGEAGAILLSFVQTCRGLGINPREYLEDVFRRLWGHSAQKLEELLPDQWLAAKLAAKHSSS